MKDPKLATQHMALCPECKTGSLIVDSHQTRSDTWLSFGINEASESAEANISMVVDPEKANVSTRIVVCCKACNEGWTFHTAEEFEKDMPRFRGPPI